MQRQNIAQRSAGCAAGCAILEGVRADLDNSALAVAFAARSLPKLQRMWLLADCRACLAAAELHAVAAVNRLHCRGTISGRALMCVLCHVRTLYASAQNTTGALSQR